MYFIFSLTRSNQRYIIHIDTIHFDENVHIKWIYNCRQSSNKTAINFAWREYTHTHTHKGRRKQFVFNLIIHIILIEFKLNSRHHRRYCERLLEWIYRVVAQSPRMVCVCVCSTTSEANKGKSWHKQTPPHTYETFLFINILFDIENESHNNSDSNSQTNINLVLALLVFNWFHVS